jgi:phage recombination protein Bet
MNEVANLSNKFLLELGVSDATYNTLKNSLYPGAKDASIIMVIEYCKAAKLDPLQKPVHIVPMSVKNNVTGNYEFRDVIMPGIGLYRTQAERSGTYAGICEPEYGPDVTEDFDGIKVTYPLWCRVVVKKIVQGHLCEFVAKELWRENYATGGKNTSAPNAMWKKRPYGQLSKCAEAQALRRGWPELIGSQPTAEEMEGKTLEGDEVSVLTPPVSRAEGLKQKMKEAKKEIVLEELAPVISLADILNKISLSENLEELEGVVGLADGLGLEEKKVARVAYKQRFTGLSAGEKA